MRIFLLNLIIVKRERNEKEKEKKNLPWFLLFKSLLLNQSLFWGRHSMCVGYFFTPFSPTRREYIITPSWRLNAHDLWINRTKQTEMVYLFCIFLGLTMFACEVEREKGD